MARYMEHYITLDDISVKHNTDQGTLGHQYLGLFELLFRHWKDQPIRLLEIGWQFGNSAKTWREYFPKATIHGIDTVDNKSPVAGAELFIGDAYKEEIFTRLLPEYDIIIDDDSHFPETQVWFLQHYHRLLAKDGLMIVEDVLNRETIGVLKAALPEGFNYCALDMTEGHALVDSRLFILWRK